MARLQVEIDGNASGLIGSLKQANNGLSLLGGAVDKLQTKFNSINGNSIGGLKNRLSALKSNLESSTDIRSIVKYNIRIRETQEELNRLRDLGLRTGSSLSSAFENGIPGKINNFTGSIKSASGVTTEFNRIIQDSPFGGIGIGNNITQLTDQFNYLKQQTGSTKEAFKAIGTSFVSTGNLVSLAISAVMTGWVLWERHAQKANKATKELEDGTKTYIETLEGLQRASADGQNNAQKDLTNLKLMYDATQNLTIPMKDRKRAADELIKQYPKQFEGLTTEAVLAGKAADAYNKLTASITATAMAAAYANKMTENAQKQLNNYLQIVKEQQEVNKLGLRIAEQEARAVSAMGKGTSDRTDAMANSEGNLLNELKDQRIAKEQLINKLGTENSNITNENTLLQKNYNDQIIKGADASGKLNTSLDKTKKKTKDMTDGLIEQLQGGLMSEFDRKLFEIGNRYDEIRKKISEIGDAGKRDNAFGLARQLELIEKLKVETERFIYMTQGLKSMNTVSPNLTTNSAVLPGRDAAIKRFNKPIKANTDNWDKVVEEMEKNLNRAVSNFGRDFIKTLSTINQQADMTFGKVFNSVVDSGISGINEVVQQGLLKGVGDFFEGRLKDLGKTGNDWVAGLGLAGSVLSGVTKKSDAIGQIGGGALSGAAAGTAVMPGIGTAIGAAVGAISGLLSADSAKKQEKLQEQQLAEQRKQTALLSRQNALAWAANIIGQMTSNGLVTSIDRDARGQLVSRVSGKDLEFVLQSNNIKR